VPRDPGSARLAQDYVALKQSYKEITSKLQKARLDSQVIESGKLDRFRVVDKANLPELPVWPNRRVLAVISVFIGLGVGIGSLFCLTLRKVTSLQDAVDVSYYTGLPLLGVVPTIATPAEQALLARKRKTRLIIGTVFGAIAVFAVSKALMIAHFFELVVRR